MTTEVVGKNDQQSNRTERDYKLLMILCNSCKQSHKKQRHKSQRH